MVHTIKPAELAAMIASRQLDLVDVRDPSEWHAGHLEGARLVPLEQLRADPDASLVRGRAIVFICGKGIRSLQAAKLADRFGYDVVYSLDGGTKEWSRSGLPLVVESLAA